MPWKVNGVMEQRFELIRRFHEGQDGIAELARQHEVSRKTIYKWLQRYESDGLEGLGDRSSRPLRQASRTGEQIEHWIVDLRHAHQSWGPKKLRSWLTRHKPETPWPAVSTIGLILQRHGLSGAAKKRRRATPSHQPLQQAQAPNQIWCIDFKGWFRCGERRCDPLTVSDAASRYLLCCRAVYPPNGTAVKQELIGLFRRHGLPQRMRSDNGAPFASTGVGGLSRLSAWWVRLGILPERIEPGEPQQNGRHERMHRTLKQETARPPAGSVSAQQRRFNRFMEEYNFERPHEALHGDTPSEHYECSPIEYPETLPPLEYPEGWELRRADEGGKIRWKQARCFVGSAVAGEVVGLEEVDNGVVRVWFGPVLLGLLDERPGHSPTRHKEHSHWPPLQSPSGLLAARPAVRHDELEKQNV
jgi:transposase InsO family protein